MGCYLSLVDRRIPYKLKLVWLVPAGAKLQLRLNICVGKSFNGLDLNLPSLIVHVRPIYSECALF